MQFTTPLNRQIIQRSRYNTAMVTLTGTYTSEDPAKIRARLVPVRAGQGLQTEWQDLSFSNHSFTGKFLATGGWYRVEWEALTSNNVAQESGTLDRFGIGEVVVVAGHSVAQGGDTYINGTADDRVNCIPLDTIIEQTSHVKTGKIEDMPAIKFVQFGTGVRPAPFGPNNYFWSLFGEKLAARINVPVLIYQTAFGGTNLQHWADSSQGIPFPLFSVNPNIGLPYVNLKHVLQKYVPVTGLRAVLIDHGQNDYGELNEELLLTRYTTMVTQARTDAGKLTLAAVINRQTPFLTRDANYQGGPPMYHIRRVQEKMAQMPYCVAGPDYDKGLLPADRFDNIHLSESGQTKAASLWADSLTDAFFQSSDPVILEPVPVPEPSQVVLDPTSQPNLTPTTTNPEPSPAPADLVTGAIPSRGGIISSSILPDLSKISNLAVIGLIMLAIGSLAFFLRQTFKND